MRLVFGNVYSSPNPTRRKRQHYTAAIILFRVLHNTFLACLKPLSLLESKHLLRKEPMISLEDYDYVMRRLRRDPSSATGEAIRLIFVHGKLPVEAIRNCGLPMVRLMPVYEEARQIIERLVTTKAAGLDRTASWFREQSIAVPGAMGLVPGRLHRSQLHHLLRRTPTSSPGPLPTCCWSDLTGGALAPDLSHGLDSSGHNGEAERPEERATWFAGLRNVRSRQETCRQSAADQRSQQGPGKVQWRLYMALWGIVLLLALGVWSQQERNKTPVVRSLSMSSLGKMQVGQRKLLRKLEFCHVSEFSIGRPSI